MPRPFLTARWANLILAQYAVPAGRLRPFLPPGVELDSWRGEHFVSLVGFQFLDTRVLGVSWPGYRAFPEWNLRFYVRRDDQRGVCFIREFVPSRFVASVARLVYNEPYRSAPMGMAIKDQPDAVAAEYAVAWGGRTHTLWAVGAKPGAPPAAGSADDFFLNQAWGYGVSRRGRCIRYEVTHPEWDVYPVRDYRIDVDWAALYGPAWADLNGRDPASVYLAAGSAVSVYPHGTL
jgi:uncharacterized protein YqjF (DUF2071 family)